MMIFLPLSKWSTNYFHFCYVSRFRNIKKLTTRRKRDCVGLLASRKHKQEYEQDSVTIRCRQEFPGQSKGETWRWASSSCGSPRQRWPAGSRSARAARPPHSDRWSRWCGGRLELRPARQYRRAASCRSETGRIQYVYIKPRREKS